VNRDFQFEGSLTKGNVSEFELAYNHVDDVRLDFDLSVSSSVCRSRWRRTQSELPFRTGLLAQVRISTAATFPRRSFVPQLIVVLVADVKSSPAPAPVSPTSYTSTGSSSTSGSALASLNSATQPLPTQQPTDPSSLVQLPPTATAQPASTFTDRSRKKCVVSHCTANAVKRGYCLTHSGFAMVVPSPSADGSTGRVGST
jgi:hypothetical protein